MKNISVNKKYYLKRNQKNKSVKQIIFNIYLLTNKEMKLKMLLNISISFLSGIIDGISIGSLIPFILVLLSPESIYSSIFIKKFIPFLLSFDTYEIILIFFVFLISVNILSAFLKIFLIKYTLKLSTEIGSYFAKFAFKNIISKDLLNFRSNEHSNYINILTAQLNNTVGFINNIQFIISGLIISFLIIISTLFINLEAALISLFSFTLAYIFIALFTKKRLSILSKRILSGSQNYYKVVKESLTLFRQINLMNLNSLYGDKIYSESFNYRKQSAQSVFISRYPKFLLDASAIIIISSISLYTFNKSPNPAQTLSLMSGIALAAQKLLPNLQLVYHSWSNLVSKKMMTFNVLDNIIGYYTSDEESDKREKLNGFSKLKLNSVYFSYSSSKNYALENINLEINKGEFIGIKGRSGEGKTTLMDLMIGFLSPSKGEVIFKNELDKYCNVSLKLNEWRNIIGYVPQEIELVNTTLAGNIAINEVLDPFKKEKIVKLLEIVNLQNIYSDESQIFNKKIGEYGINLSGGQRQRVGIARSLFNNPEIIFLDEATNGLDKKTESKVISNIRANFPFLSLITISHRDSLLKLCDKIYNLENKNLVELEK